MEPLSPAHTIFDPEHFPLVERAARLVANPFSPDWDARMKEALGAAYVEEDLGENAARGSLGANMTRFVGQILRPLLMAREALSRGAQATPVERAVYRDAMLLVLWDNFGAKLQEIIDGKRVEVPFLDAFLDVHRNSFASTRIEVPEPGRLLSLLYQARRTWYFAATLIRGRSPSARAARVALWQASMGSDLCTYAGGLYRRMDDIPVLITGETGTGKELAARVVGFSRYIALDLEKRRFARPYDEDFHVRSLCEASAELLESKLFGHRKGAFTGAHADARGIFSLAGVNGTLFLDEFGEIPPSFQAKLLRPLETRDYLPLGDHRARRFDGRIVCATLRDLEAACAAGTFRRDLLQRISGVRVHMPPLRQMLAEAPEDLGYYVRIFLAEALDGGGDVGAWTDRVMGSLAVSRLAHAWPGNLRELKLYTKQFVLTEGPPLGMGGEALPAAAVVTPVAPAAPPERAPAFAAPPPSTAVSVAVPSSETLGQRTKAGKVRHEDLMRAYVSYMYLLCNENAAETARQTGLDYRTVMRWIDEARLERRRRSRSEE